MGVSGGEIIFILLFVLLFFGSKQIPNIARTLGKGIRELNRATDEIKKEINDQTRDFSNQLKNKKDNQSG